MISPLKFKCMFSTSVKVHMIAEHCGGGKAVKRHSLVDDGRNAGQVSWKCS